MADYQKYSFRPYSSKYPVLYRQERKRLLKIIPHAEIDHIGSTAVPELGGKGIIDISVAVDNDLWKYKIALEKNHYEFQPEGGSAQRLFFRRRIIRKGNERRVHIHLVLKSSKTHIAPISVRDYLRKNPDVCRKYEFIKKTAVTAADGDGSKYREYKQQFLEKLEATALECYMEKIKKKRHKQEL